MMKTRFRFLLVALLFASRAGAQSQLLHSLQQNFVDLRFGMFIHFNMPTFYNED